MPINLNAVPSAYNLSTVKMNFGSEYLAQVVYKNNDGGREFCGTKSGAACICMTAVNWVIKAIRRMTRRKGSHQWGKIFYCIVTLQYLLDYFEICL
jgi:hypothetical protein